MNLTLDGTKGACYKSLSQKARVLTEDWSLRNLYCPACTSDRIVKRPNNEEAIDFSCPECQAPFQLKARQETIGHKVADEAMKRALLADRFPHLLLMRYDLGTLRVLDIEVVPKYLLSLSAIERRKPLAPTARRAGWIGCNIVLDQVPPDGRVSLIKDRAVRNRRDVRAQFRMSRGFSRIETIRRGWVLDVLIALRSLDKTEFRLNDAYAFEKILSALHPGNRYVREKIRQQLQVLRDLGYVDFLGRGRYRLKRGKFL